MIRVADLYSGAGGVAHAVKSIEETHPAEIHVTGIDIEDYSDLYPGDEFIRADATNPPLDQGEFDIVWASPPCTAYSKVSATHYGSAEAARRQNPTIPELDVYSVVETLAGDDGEWIVENVPGAERDMRAPSAIDGGGLGGQEYQMRRLFDTSFTLPPKTWDRSGLTSDPSAEITAPITTHTQDRCAARLKEAKNLPDSWPVRRQLIRSAIPRDYVEYILHYCPAIDAVPLPDGVETEQTTLEEVRVQ